MLFNVLGTVLMLVSLGSFVFVLRHAFGRSIGTGVIVLCIPFYNLYYAFSQFEHRRKYLIVPLWLAAFGLGAVLLAFGAPSGGPG